MVELRWGSRGPGPPERPGCPRETSVLRGFKGTVKGPLKLQEDHPSFIDALLQFVLLCAEIAVEKHFDPPKCDFWRGLWGASKKVSMLAIARHISRPRHKLCCNSTTAKDLWWLKWDIFHLSTERRFFASSFLQRSLYMTLALNGLKTRQYYRKSTTGYKQQCVFVRMSRRVAWFVPPKRNQ